MARFPLVAPIDEGNLWQTIHRLLRVRDLQPHIVLSVASTLARLDYVEPASGLTITSLNGVPAELASKLAWICAVRPTSRDPFGLISRTKQLPVTAGQRFAEFLIASVPAS